MVKLFMCPDCHDKDSPWLRRELGDHFEVEDFGNFLVVTTNSDIPVLSNVCSCKHVGPVAMLPQSEVVSSYPPPSGHSVTPARQPSGPDRAASGGTGSPPDALTGVGRAGQGPNRQ